VREQRAGRTLAASLRIASALTALTAPFILAARPVEPQAPAAIDLPGGSIGVGFDDLRYAPALGAVLAPAGRSGRLDLVDPATGKVTPISGFSEAATWGGGHDQGVTSADEGAGLLFATDRTSGELVLLDPKARKVVSRTKLGGAPDYVRFVPATKEVWVTEPDSERIEIFRLDASAAPPSAVSVGSIAVKGGPESLVVDSKGGRAYTHLWDGETVAIDVARRTTVGKWKNGCRGSRGIALDESRGLLFAGCAEGKAVVMSAADGRELASASSGDGVDIIDYDAGSRRLFLPGGKSATMAIFDVSPDGKLSLVRVVPTAAGSHCVAAAPNGSAFVCDPKKGRLLRFAVR
jgi:DNA-binding beta-propeller fold protein YncE